MSENAVRTRCTRLNLISLFLISLLFTPIALVADDGAEADVTDAEVTEAEVTRLLSELDAPSVVRRNTAEKRLVELGTAIVPFLPPQEATLSSEVAKRLARIRQAVAKATTSDSVAKKIQQDVRLGDSATLGAALEAISRDSGIEFDHDADSEKTIQPFSAPLPFWHAVDYVLDQAELDIDLYSGDKSTLALVPRNPDRPSRVDSAAYAGIYRLEPTMVTSRRVLRNSNLSGMTVEIELTWKPDANPVGISLPLSQITAKLDDGATIRSQNAEGSIDIAPTDEVPTTSMQLPLTLPAGRPVKILSISGQIQSMLPGAIKQFDFPLGQGPQTQNVDSVTVRLEEVRKNGPLHEVRMGIEFKSPGKAMESHRGWLLGNEVTVLMKDGTTSQPLGYELYRHNDIGIGIGYLFDIGDTPGESKLIYKTPTAVIQNNIDFVIQEIAMP